MHKLSLLVLVGGLSALSACAVEPMELDAPGGAVADDENIEPLLPEEMNTKWDHPLYKPGVDR